MALLLLNIFGPPRTARGGPAAQAARLPDALAALLDRVAGEEQRITWEALEQYSRAYNLPLEWLVARAWGQRFPYVELLAAGLSPEYIRRVERRWAAQSPKEQTGSLRSAFAAARSGARTASGN